MFHTHSLSKRASFISFACLLQLCDPLKLELNHEFAKMQAHVRCTRCQLRSCLQVALPRLLPCSPLLFADCLCPPNWLDMLSKVREVGNQTFVLVYASHRHTLLCLGGLASVCASVRLCVVLLGFSVS